LSISLSKVWQGAKPQRDLAVRVAGPDQKSSKADNYATAKDVSRGFAEAFKRFYAAFQLHR
jgi:hypothetical protein